MSTVTPVTPVNWSKAYGAAYRFFDCHPEGQITMLVDMGTESETGEPLGTRSIVFKYDADLEIARIDHEATDEAN